MPEDVSHRQRIKWKKTAMLLLLMAAVVAVVALTGGCPVRKFFGVPCPGCGMTRACLALLRLDFRAAFAYHPLVFALVPGMLYVVCREFLPITLGRRAEAVMLAVFLLAMALVYCCRMLVSHAAGWEMAFSNPALQRIIQWIGGSYFYETF